MEKVGKTATVGKGGIGAQPVSKAIANARTIGRNRWEASL
jgi:hypothetical protein